MSSGPAARGADLEAVLRDFFARSGPDIVAVYLFGSQARGTARADSDVDVAILYDRQPPVSLEGLLDRDRGMRIRFEVRARNEFFDLKPVLDRYRAPRL